MVSSLSRFHRDAHRSTSAGAPLRISGSAARSPCSALASLWVSGIVSAASAPSSRLELLLRGCIGFADAFRQLCLRTPAECLDARYIEQLSRRSVGLGCVET